MESPVQNWGMSTAAHELMSQEEQRLADFLIRHRLRNPAHVYHRLRFKHPEKKTNRVTVWRYLSGDIPDRPDYILIDTMADTIGCSTEELASILGVSRVCRTPAEPMPFMLTAIG